jgi:hypothetical protein
MKCERASLGEPTFARRLSTEAAKPRRWTATAQPRGVITRGVPQLAIRVVPDSSTGQLVGISGTMTINIVGGEHFYEFDYTIAAAR